MRCINDVIRPVLSSPLRKNYNDDNDDDDDDSCSHVTITLLTYSTLAKHSCHCWGTYGLFRGTTLLARGSVHYWKRRKRRLVCLHATSRDDDARSRDYNLVRVIALVVRMSKEASTLLLLTTAARPAEC